MSTALYLDNSTLAAISRCSTEAFVRYFAGYTSPEERATLRSGSAAHESIAVYFRTGDAEQALAKFAESYEAWAEENVSPTDRLSYANTSRILGEWFRSHPLHELPFKVDPEMVEIGFAYPLLDEGTCLCGHSEALHNPDCDSVDCNCPEFCVLVICGRIDALANGIEIPELHVIEHKTTGNISPYWLKKFRMDSQNSTYLWAAQQHTGRPVTHSFLNAIEFAKIPSDPSKKCKTHAVTYDECGHLHSTFELLVVTRTPTQIEEWKKSATHLARRFRELTLRFPDIKSLHKVRMQGMFNGSCPNCALHDFCVVDRPLAMVGSMLVHDPWSPFDYAQGAVRESARKP